MITPVDRSTERRRVHKRIRHKISGGPNRPRLCIYRSLRYIYAQIVDDQAGHTLVSASSIDATMRPKVKGLPKTEQARIVGQLVAERARDKGIKTVVFDRGGFRYMGRVKALAEAARQAGLEF